MQRVTTPSPSTGRQDAPARESSRPAHLDPPDDPNHTGVCQDCGYPITVGPTGVEYGHARRKDRQTGMEHLGDCEYRPAGVDPGIRGAE